MKKVAHFLLGIFALSHLNILARDTPSLSEKSPLFQASQEENQQDRQERITIFAAQTLIKATKSSVIPVDPELLLLLSIGMRLNDQKKKNWSIKKIQAPYYKNLPVLLEYLVGLRSDQFPNLEDKWKFGLVNTKYALSMCNKVTDTKTLNFLDLILNDISFDKDKAINAYYDLIDHIMQKIGLSRRYYDFSLCFFAKKHFGIKTIMIRA